MSATNNQALKCSQAVRAIPLARYRLPSDGRKWKQRARSRSALLLRLSSYANSDGSFLRDGRNYSPSLKTLLNHVGHGSFYELTNELQATGLLSWTREKHYERRAYTIRLPESGPVFDQNQASDSEITGPRFDGEDLNQVRDSQNQVRDSQITGPMGSNHPSSPSLPSKERESRPAPKAAKDFFLSLPNSENLGQENLGQNEAAEAAAEVEASIESALSAIKTEAVEVNGAAFTHKGSELLSEALRHIYRENGRHNRYTEDGDLLDCRIIAHITRARLAACDQFQLRNFSTIFAQTFVEEYRKEFFERRDAAQRAGRSGDVLTP